MQAAMVLHMNCWLRPGQAIYPELGPVEAAVAKVVRQEYNSWRQQAPPELRGQYIMRRAGVVDGVGRYQLYSQAAIEAGMAALQRAKEQRAPRPVQGQQRA
jgi:hypothetical protein